MDEVWREIGVADLLEKKGMLDNIEGFADVNGNNDRPQGWFLLVEAVGDVRRCREKSSHAGVVGTEAVLSRCRLEMRRDERKHETLENFGGGREEGDWTVRGGEMSGFTGFRDRKN